MTWLFKAHGRENGRKRRANFKFLIRVEKKVKKHR